MKRIERRQPTQWQEIELAAFAEREAVLLKRGRDDSTIGAIKLAMNALGVPISPAVRAPTLPADEGAREAIETILKEAGVLDTSKAG